MPAPDQIRFLILIVPIVLFLIGLKRPVYAVVGYMVLVYCKVSFYYPFMGMIKAELVFAIIVLLRIFTTGNIKYYLSQDTTSISKYILLLTLCIILSFSIAWDYSYSWNNAVYHYIKTIILFVMIVGALNDKNDIKIFISSFFLMYLYLAYEPMYNFISGVSGNVQVYGTNYIADIGILSGHVALANNMNQMLPLAWYFFWANENKYLKLISATCFVAFLLALIGSGSRGGIIGMAVWGLLIVWFSKNRLKMFMLMSVIAGALLISYSSHIVSTASRIDSSATQSRLSGLSHGVGMVLKGNVLGVGPGCYLFARGRYFSYTMESHNIYGQILGDLGIPGAIVTFMLILHIFKATNKIIKNQNYIVKNRFIYYLIVGISVSLVTRLVISLGSHGLYFFYWYVIAAIVIVTARLVENDEDTLKENTENKKINQNTFVRKKQIS
jgi:O-antigen ligase